MRTPFPNIESMNANALAFILPQRHMQPFCQRGLPFLDLASMRPCLPWCCETCLDSSAENLPETLTPPSLPPSLPPFQNRITLQPVRPPLYHRRPPSFVPTCSTREGYHAWQQPRRQDGRVRRDLVVVV